MGDRANIILTEQRGEEVGRMYLYTHWHGSAVERLAAKGVAQAIAYGRDDDPQYGGRIVTEVFLSAHHHSLDTGCGVGALLGDGGDHTVELNFSNQTATVTKSRETKSYSFAEFVAQYHGDAEDPAEA